MSKILYVQRLGEVPHQKCLCCPRGELEVKPLNAAVYTTWPSLNKMVAIVSALLREALGIGTHDGRKKQHIPLYLYEVYDY